jgi:hypothetical protein
MRRREALLTLAAGALPALAAPVPQGEDEHLKFVRACLEDIRSVKPGVSRADLLKKFKQAGGLYNRKLASYSYLRCPFFKVSVTFEPSGPGEALAADDKVVKVPTPYLEDPLAE